jgi:hypothetical protein
MDVASVAAAQMDLHEVAMAATVPQVRRPAPTTAHLLAQMVRHLGRPRKNTPTSIKQP